MKLYTTLGLLFISQFLFAQDYTDYLKKEFAKYFTHDTTQVRVQKSFDHYYPDGKLIRTMINFKIDSLGNPYEISTRAPNTTVDFNLAKAMERVSFAKFRGDYPIDQKLFFPVLFYHESDDEIAKREKRISKARKRGKYK
ncbi:hypothetical protein [Gilvibacter sp.]|jgi:hypothetical protein|uniref:hypothetical protein n=1 Tax=Gilvibacter sp. TaxID=2729997 RepID=UPI003B518CF6